MPFSKKHRQALSPIGSVIADLLNRHRPEMAQGMIEIWQVWEKVVGSEIAGHTKPAAIKGDLLLVHVSSSAWLHHLRFLEAELVGRLNRAVAGSRIKSLKLKIGPI